MEITNFRVINKHALKSVFTLHIPEWGGIEIDCASFETDKGASWINFAAKEYVNKEGQRKTFNQVRWPQAVRDKLIASIKDKIQVLEKTQAAPVPMSKEEELPF